jgi:hypothetical protein
LHDLADVDGEVGKPGGGAGFFMELLHGKAPASLLVPGVLTHDPVEPALDATGQQKIQSSWMVSTPPAQRRLGQPVWERDDHAGRLASGFVNRLGPTVKPMK